MRYAILEGNVVVNVIVWDGETLYPESDATRFIGETDVGIGWSIVDDQWVPPDRPEEPMPEEE